MQPNALTRRASTVGTSSGKSMSSSRKARAQKLLTSDHEIKAELGTREAEGGELGGPKGGRVGILVTVLAAVGAAVAVPAIGFVVGPLAIALTAAGAAGVAGGLIAALGDWGVPEERIRGYEADIRKGAILMSVEAASAADAERDCGRLAESRRTRHPPHLVALPEGFEPSYQP